MSFDGENPKYYEGGEVMNIMNHDYHHSLVLDTNISISNNKSLKVARNTRDYSHSLRQEAKQLRIDADAKTKWFNYENNVKLNERVRNITEWRDKLDQCLRDLNLEISVQKDAKEACERALEAKVLSESSKFSTKLPRFIPPRIFPWRLAWRT